MKKIKLEIVALDRVVITEDVDSMVVTLEDGMLGILPDHAPMMAALEIGELHYNYENVCEKVAVMGGIIRFNDNNALVITSAAERAKDVDILRAEKNKERAEFLLKNKQLDHEEIVEAHNLLTKSMTRLRITGKSK